MLQSIRIQNYALIQKLDMQFSDGFTIITGETGAGKSILLGALSMVLGQRADTSMLKNKNEKCVVEADFFLKKFNLKELFEKHELDYADETILRREISPAGKTRAFVNDTPVNLQVLKEIGTRLVDIHSQHQNLNLHDHLFQLHVVDVYAGNHEFLTTYLKAYNNYSLLKDQYQALSSFVEKAKKEHDFLEFQFRQLEESNLQENEQEDLEKEQAALSHAEEIKIAFEKAGYLLEGEDNPANIQVKEANTLLQDIQSFFPEAESLQQRLESCYIELKDISNEINRLESSVEVDPGRLAFVNERLDLIYSLQQKHGVESVKELLDIKENIDQQLNDILNFDSRLEDVNQKMIKQENIVKQMATQLSAKRKTVFEGLEKMITKLLTQQGIPNAAFQILSRDKLEPDENGADEISFLFSANKNSPVQDIVQVASGGEMSRLMLSIKYLLSQSIALPTIIFDEIDTGVSGEIADKVGNIMKQMSGKLQVINITHLPQIAAKGNDHFLVYKIDENDGTYTHIRKLEKQERLQEIAKMLSGELMTSAALENAKVLLEK